MDIYIFTGPTISPQEACTELDAVYLPPVSQGDIYRVMQWQPKAIGIIDGYFERVPAVWHKEILWAMTQHIHVFGSSSMGALRATELAAFGMEGVGKIFEAYQSGILEDDDEVAVVHASAEFGYRAQSEAMVNIRFTLQTALAAQVISGTTGAVLERVAKELFYPHRLYPVILQRASAEGAPESELQAFSDWLPRGRVDQKREDAYTLLRVMQDRLSRDLEPKQVHFFFEQTEFGQYASNHAGDLFFEQERETTLPVSLETQGDAVSLDHILDEMRIEDPEAYGHVRQGALTRLLSLDEARRRGFAASSAGLDERATLFRYTQGLHEEDLELWARQSGFNDAQMLQVMEEEILLMQLEKSIKQRLFPYLPHYLRVVGTYIPLLQKAREKQMILAFHGLQDPAFADSGLTEQELLQWYFEERLTRPVVTDLASHATRAGFKDTSAFLRALLREYCYAMHKDTTHEDLTAF